MLTKPVRSSCDGCQTGVPAMLVATGLQRGATGHRGGPRHEYAFCPPCFQRVTEAFWGHNGRPLFGEFRAASPANCDFCEAVLGDEVATLEVIPTRRLPATEGRRQLDGRSWFFRTCLACHAASRSALYDAAFADPAASTAAFSGIEDLSAPADAYAVGLLPDDEACARSTFPRFARLSPATLGDATQQDGAVLLVGAASRGSATAVLSVLPEAWKRRALVIARFDMLRDLAGARLLGVQAFAASPLSPAALRFAAHRVLQDAADTSCVIGRCQELAVHPPSNRGRLVVAWLLRRVASASAAIEDSGAGPLVVHLHGNTIEATDAWRRLAFIFQELDCGVASPTAHVLRAAG